MEEEFQDTITESVNLILYEINEIVETDIGSIEAVANSSLYTNESFLVDTVDQILERLEIIREKKSFFEESFQNGTEKIDEFLLQDNTKKMQNLKAAQIFIKSQTDLKEPV